MPTRKCIQCDKAFNTTKKSRVFCSPTCRVTHHRENNKRCWYCGELAESMDHMAPKAYVQQGDTVPCCKQCNDIMTDKFPNSVEARVEYLASRIYKNYALDRPDPVWEESDFEDMSDTLIQHVRAKLAEKEQGRLRYAFVMARLAWLRKNTTV